MLEESKELLYWNWGFWILRFYMILNQNPEKSPFISPFLLSAVTTIHAFNNEIGI